MIKKRLKKDSKEKKEPRNINRRKCFITFIVCFIFSSILFSVYYGNSISNLQDLGPYYRNVDFIVITSMRKDLKVVFLLLLGLIITMIILNRKESVKTTEKLGWKCWVRTLIFILVFFIFNLVNYRNDIMLKGKSDKLSYRQKRFENFMLCKRTFECRRYLDKIIAINQEVMLTEYEFHKRRTPDRNKEDFRGETQNYYYLISY